jgi:hypothetical protein
VIRGRDRVLAARCLVYQFVTSPSNLTKRKIAFAIVCVPLLLDLHCDDTTVMAEKGECNAIWYISTEAAADIEITSNPHLHA